MVTEIRTEIPAFDAEAPATEPVQAAKEPKAPEQDTTDWKAEAEKHRTRAEVAEAARLKAEKDTSSLKGELRQRADVNARIDDIWGALKVLNRGDPEVEQAVAKIEGEARTRTASNAFAARYDTVLAAIQDAVNGEDGAPVLDLNTAPELADVRERWNAAQRGQDLPELALLVAETSRLTRAAERRTLKAETAAAKAEALKAKQEAAQERGELDMEGGGSPMAGAASDGKLVSAYAAGTIGYKEARNALKRAGIVE